MIAEMWRSFPRLIEQNINGLLDTAPPNPAKAFMLYKTCQQEELWSEDYPKFAKKLHEFFSTPRGDRRKGHFDQFLNRPMDQDTYSNFHVNFRSATVSEKALNNVANWAHNLIRVSRKTTSAVISMEIMVKTLKYITNPPPFEKAENIEFEDFCVAWQKTVFKAYGKQHDRELGSILTELTQVHARLKEAEQHAQLRGMTRTYDLTQTEVDWVQAVRSAAFELQDIPDFPIVGEPQKDFLKDLVRVIALYRVVQTTKFPELIKHRGNIRSTILDRCDRLLPRDFSSAA